jgi:hypothetical protein
VKISCALAIAMVSLDDDGEGLKLYTDRRA